ncbi:MAG: ribosome silencing factor [Spirochaetia bacterium]|nr:ribosome silencing factor [Spirochaetia bacterium]
MKNVKTGAKKKKAPVGAKVKKASGVTVKTTSGKKVVKKAKPAAVKATSSVVQTIAAVPGRPAARKGDEQKVAVIVNALDGKKAEDIKVFNVANQSDMWDYFIVCTGTASVHNRAIRDSLKKAMAESGYHSLYEDRDYDTHWIVIDYTDILVHIFDRETRLYYSIEKIWGENEEPAEKYLKAGGA